MSEKHLSEAVSKLAVWLSGLVSFSHVEEIMQRVGQMSVSGSTVWRQTQKWGRRFEELEAEARDRASVVGGLPDQSGPERGQEVRLGASLDGTLVHIREEGWKEVKVGCVCERECMSSFM